MSTGAADADVGVQAQAKSSPKMSTAGDTNDRDVSAVDGVWWWRMIWQRHDSYDEHVTAGDADDVLCHSHCIVRLRIPYPCHLFVRLSRLYVEISLVSEDDPVKSHPFADTDCDVVYPPVNWLLKSLDS